MKKNNLLHSILFISLFFPGLISQAQNTVLSGHLKGLSGRTIEIFYIKNGVSITDSVTVVRDTFTWKTNLEEPLRLALTVGHNNYFFFFAEPGHIKLTGIKDVTKSYIISGSPIQQDAEAFSVFIKDLTDQRDSLNSNFSNASVKEKAGINNKRDDLKKQLQNRTAQFIASHPKSSFNMYLISLEKDYNEIRRLYNELDESAQQTNEGKKIAQKLETLAKGQVGMQIADFTQPDTSGHPVKFSSFKGKYVLIDFWASWCAPCRAENPNVLKAYQAFKNKNFTVIGISLDDKAANWKKAIRDDNMPWTQLSDLKGWKNEVSAGFGIEFIPSNLLIDPSGKIIAKDLRGAMLENKLKELLN